jgi:hypothetical protein
MPDVTPDLDAVITNAVNARIEAEVIKALSGDEVIGRLVMAALQQPVSSNDFMRSKAKPFLTHVLEKAIQEATKSAVTKILAEEGDRIEQAVRGAILDNVYGFANQLVTGLKDRAGQAYGVDVKVDLKMPRNDF